MRLSAIILIAAISLAQAASEDEAFGPDRAFRLESSGDGFGERSHGVVETANGRSNYYPLPQSAFEDYARLRPGDLSINPFTAKDYDRQEVIGPHQVEGNKLWFGKDFYEGEGELGVGAFGYFDTATRQYQLFSPPEVAPWQISAILVEKDSVWMGLDRFGEDISTSPGGLARWDRSTHEMHLYRLEFVVKSIERRGDALRLGSISGYADLRNSVLHRFEIRRDDSGASFVVPVDKFPPPPTHN
jgi:hypothetical protein